MRKRALQQSNFQIGLDEKKYIRLEKDFLTSSVRSPHIVNYARNVFEETKKEMDKNTKLVTESTRSANIKPRRNDKLNLSMALDNSSVK